MIESGCLKEEHRTAAPWSISNQHIYLEKSRPSDGYTPLHLAAEMDLARLCRCIIHGGARPDLRDNQGRTALMIAARCGSVKSLEALLSCGVPVDSCDNSGKQAIHHAIAEGREAAKILDDLLKAGAYREARDDAGLTPLMLAAASQASECLEVLYRHGAKQIAFDFKQRSVLEHGSALRRSDRHPAETSRLPPRKRYPRWDNTGQSTARHMLLFEDRTFRRRAVPEFERGDQDRLHAVTKLLC
eukprot:CAMPEP_0194759204 /NCGR_PEP_ID=MMETSP0323_2-20130528/12292_1 /TAXON_ID=2866 ORGANISM="Crypthecodinium cohnii, Strain Seligo" /NCGR_SAMPLE_ID=MMETSP0323_2 /ASSEMBLY_ACC=CAM_ASM_000346 /LENGTH=243 /DNA_ID=CAMNT_0039679809 /DNA_START=9 /DNA_END=740 /DNA_ORIENTATION=+